MPNKAVVVHESKEQLIDAVAGRFVSVVRAILQGSPTVHVCLTGGSVGIAVLRAIAEHAEVGALEWDRVHVWWGDERWLESGDAERNDHQADLALLTHVAIPSGNVHRFPAADAGIALDDAALQYRDELARHAGNGGAAPAFDVTFLGVGPDGHVASLFPHFEQVNAQDSVVAVRNSPKPPPERLSLTLPVINSSERIWLALAGTDKASPIGLALAGASRDLVPVAGVKGVLETVFFVDEDAAADVPRELIVDSY
ncbi:6-phosphogluconolactonase [Salinibacterium sp. dk2585]|uniref:6-phosphogluconolactonase n=1 Tax=unclassified Salinibacterium TaxID=2632331 RepID=UPI0011C24D50|nr:MULTISPECIES: 6-phosphogluconolactonase [unclassified Salinibacterium]QEE61228.1 6-phosphogluconolactonase [Salinibacterium sp. dk2585]TXK53903.1 6-phosphogluconolactonase [Salinibacterium sp. dk5596]